MKESSCELDVEKGGRLITPCILLSLKDEPLHGYGLLEKIMAFGFSSEPIDISVVYRHLKKLEDQDYIQFEWNTTSTGPAKKVYALTADGEDALKAYQKLIVYRKEKIERFLEKYEALMGV